MGIRQAQVLLHRSNAVLAGLALLFLSVAPAPAQGTRESPPRQPPATSRVPSSTTTPVSPPAPPPSTPSSPGSASDSPGNRGGGGSGYGYGRYRYPRYYRYHGYGYLWPYSRFYWEYHRPYYPWGMVWYPAYSSDTRLGAVDLAVKPWRTEVYVDGEYVGRAGRFDGYPGYLWLGEGSHQLVFYRDGWQTEVRRVTIRPGPLRRLKVTLSEGPSTPPEELFEPPPRTAAKAPPRATRPAPAPRAAERPERDATLDVRGEPGRFRVDVAPADAAVYLDGRFLGSAEELSRLHSGMLIEAGEHFLEVQRPGYQAERVSFSVEPGAETEVEVALNSLEGPSD